MWNWERVHFFIFFLSISFVMCMYACICLAPTPNPLHRTAKIYTTPPHVADNNCPAGIFTRIALVFRYSRFLVCSLFFFNNLFFFSFSVLCFPFLFSSNVLLVWLFLLFCFLFLNITLLLLLCLLLIIYISRELLRELCLQVGSSAVGMIACINGCLIAQRWWSWTAIASRIQLWAWVFDEFLGFAYLPLDLRC